MVIPSWFEVKRWAGRGVEPARIPARHSARSRFRSRTDLAHGLDTIVPPGDPNGSRTTKKQGGTSVPPCPFLPVGPGLPASAMQAMTGPGSLRSGPSFPRNASARERPVQ